MKKYQVVQGRVSNTGGGDMDLFVEFDTLEEAKEYFEKVKEDTRGWNLHYKTQHLETWLCCGDEIIEIWETNHGSN